MKPTQDTYLGWEELVHRRGCEQPRWEVDLRLTHDESRYRGHGEEPLKHQCPEERCDHGNRFAAITVRIVCRSCGTAEVITGEKNDDTGRSSTSTAFLGYGLPPRKVAGLFLWPGAPFFSYGRLTTTEPHDFLVTADRVDRVEKKAVAGQITQTRGKRGGVVWSAAAVQSESGPYGAGMGLRWAHAEEGFKTITAAAKWIAARLAEHTTAGGGQR
ncbi:hypothetical protein [Streptomyces sp. NPDC006997]|uniref:hypothetical protein n=1 Tax=Streptomyces sp. NPDC006997 TaxID=3155356 RepID=UPI0033FEF055